MSAGARRVFLSRGSPSSGLFNLFPPMIPSTRKRRCWVKQWKHLGSALQLTMKEFLVVTYSETLLLTNFSHSPTFSYGTPSGP